MATVPEPLAQAAALKQEAVAVAREIVAVHPDQAISHALLGSAYYNVGQSREAVESLQRCIQLDPAQVEAYEILARVAYEKGELEEAVRLCRKGLESGRATGEILNRLGQSLLDLGRADEAIKVFEQAAGLPRVSSETHYLLGQACLQSGDYERAKAGFRAALARMPDHTQACFGLFTACARLGQAEEAARYREQFLQLEKSDRRTLTDRSAREDVLTGLPLVRQTVARTLFGAGQIRRLHGEKDQAAQLFLRAAKLDPDNGAWRASLESLYREAKAPSQAVEAFRKLVVEQPQNSLNHWFLGRAQAELGRFEAALQAYQQVQRLTPDRPDGHRSVAELCLRANREPAVALAAAERLLALDPSGPTHYLVAVARVRNGDRDGAVKAMEKAVRLSPEKPQFREFLEQLQQAAAP
jgi:tetratricopeptide (TPR) repeat protein